MTKRWQKKRVLTNGMIYSNIKYIANKRKITLKKISNLMGKSDSYLSAIFSKKEKLVALELLLEVASILQCDLEDLLQPSIDKVKQRFGHDTKNS